jgi:hypothetical protein
MRILKGNACDWIKVDRSEVDYIDSYLKREY